KTLERPGELTLAVSATDDGLPKRRGEPVGMTVMWQKYRGPGAVTFTEPQASLPGGKSSTVVTFTEPGDYVLQAVVDDGSGRASGNFGYHCCWTNVQVQVTVKGQAHASATSTSAAPITFAKDIVPIFQAKCQACHHPGTSAPMSLMTYDEVRPWARAIQQRVASRAMPPWHLDKTVGIRQDKNDRSLTDAEISNVVAW